MYSQSFALAVLMDGKVVRENYGNVKVPFGSEYEVRAKNKYASPIALDLYIDGKLVNEAGHILVAANSFMDIAHWVEKSGTGRKLVFAKLNDNRVEQPGECENGIIEARFYKPQAKVEFVPNTIIIKESVWPYYPTWPIIIHEHHHDYYPSWPNQPWITFTSDSCNVVCSSVDSHLAAIEFNGATVKGEETSKIEYSKPSFDLEVEPVVLKLKIIGYEDKTKTCCGKKQCKGEIYCSKCGKKYK